MEHNRKKTSRKKSVGQAMRWVDLADYQEGSVVSRTVIDKKTGTVTFSPLMRDKD